MEDFTNYKGTGEIVKLNIQIRYNDLMDIIMKAISNNAKWPEIYQSVLATNRVIEALKNIK